MRLSVVISQAPLNQLPDQLLNHFIQHSTDVFFKKSKPFNKLTIPPSYNENKALCQQFGISPHSLICMEPSLWRQEIIDQIVFNLSQNLIQINFINGSISIYSFEEIQQILNLIKFNNSTRFFNSSFNNSSSICEKNKLKLISHLNFLHSIQSAGDEFLSDLNQLYLLSNRELSILRKKLHPNPLTPTQNQVSLDDERARKKIQIPISITRDNKTIKKRRSSNFVTQKNRHHIKSTHSVLKLQIELSNYSETQLDESNFHLSKQELYQVILHLTRFRSALIDFFQSVVLVVLKVKLPELYSLWILQSQIESLQIEFKNCSTELTEILSKNQTLNLFQNGLYSTIDHHQSYSLEELKNWCQLVSFHSSYHSNLNQTNLINTPELISSANTSFNELSSSQIGDQILKLDPSCISSKTPNKSSSKFESSFPQDILPNLPETTILPGLSLSINTIQTKFSIDPISLTQHINSAQTLLTSQDPDNLNRSKQNRVSIQSILHIPLLLLERDLLELIKTKEEKDLAVELVIKLAERRLEMEKLEETFQILKLLEEERFSKEQFSGISRFSDIITTARLSSGMDAVEGEINQRVRIKAAMKRIAQLNSYLGTNIQSNPTKSSELKRKQAIKRKAWSALIQRLDIPWIDNNNNQSYLNHQGINKINSIWPEPIYLKKSNYRHHPKNLKRKRENDNDEIHILESNLNSPTSNLDPFMTCSKLVNFSFIHPIHSTNNPLTDQNQNQPSSSTCELRKALLNL